MCEREKEKEHTIYQGKYHKMISNVVSLKLSYSTVKCTIVLWPGGILRIIFTMNIYLFLETLQFHEKRSKAESFLDRSLPLIALIPFYMLKEP